MKLRFFAFTVAALVSAACSSSSSGGSNPNVFSVTTEAFTVQPGDYFECFYTSVTTDRELSVQNSTGKQGIGGHHITVYYVDQPQPVGHHPCVDAEMLNWHQITAAAGTAPTAGEGLVALPDGYAIKVPAGKQIVIQSHYINTTGSAFGAQDTVTLDLVDPSKVKAYANAFAMVDDQFALPPHAQHTRTSTCTLKRDYQMLLMLGHMHEYGQHFTLEQLDAQGNVVAMLYDKNWEGAYASHPPTLNYQGDAPLVLKAGTKLRQTCTWNNVSDQQIKFPREMCITYGYYFPDQGFDICAMDDLVTEQ